MEEKYRSDKMMEAVRCFLNGSTAEWEEEISCDEWSELFRLSGHHQILPMVFEAVYACPSFRSVPAGMERQLRTQVIREVLIQNRKTEEFLLIYEKLKKAGVTPVIVKGIICRDLYRKPDYRSSGDEDVLIPADQFELCHRVLQDSGMNAVQEDSRAAEAGEVTYYKKGSALHIELHKELFSSESEAYGNFNTFFTDVFRRKIEVNIGSGTVYTMCHTDHLLYLILHAFKHFLHSGFGIRQVLDISIYANTYGAEADWEYIREKCRAVHADLFAAALFDIGEKYFCFDSAKACYPETWRSREADGEELLNDLLQGGVFGDSSLSRKHSSNITLQAVVDDKNGKTAGVSVIQSLFPDKKYMERYYSYVKNYPFLLPAAWVMRIGRYAREVRKMKDNSAAESMKIGSRRVELMKKYRIIQ